MDASLGLRGSDSGISTASVEVNEEQQSKIAINLAFNEKQMRPTSMPPKPEEVKGNSFIILVTRCDQFN